VRKDNTQNYQTGQTNIRHFRDFTQNVKAEKEELKKMKGNWMKNADEPNLANIMRKKWNKVSKKWDDISKDETDARLTELEDVTEPTQSWKFSNDEVNPNHFFKNNTDVVEPVKIKKFEAFVTRGNDDVPMPKNQMVDSDCGCQEDEYMDYEGCGCCDDCTGDPDCQCCDECECGDIEEYDESCDECGEESYMFFDNLETIKGMCEEILNMDEEEVDEMLSDGHNWAEDHVSTAKESLSHVHNFLKNDVVKRHNTGGVMKNIIKGVEEFVNGVSESHISNYMFFSNLEHIVRFCEEMLDMDEDMVDDKLQSGHDWAEDHVSAAKENVQQVYDWLLSEQN
jgi:hypothetical protein